MQEPAAHPSLLATQLEVVKTLWKRYIAASNGTRQLSTSLHESLAQLIVAAEQTGIGRLADAARTMSAQLESLPPDPALWFEDARAELANSFQLIAASQWQGENTSITVSRPDALWLLQADQEAAAALAAQLQLFSFATRLFADIADLSAALESSKPQAIVVDGDEDHELSLIRNEPVFMIASQSEQQARLQAVRAGVQAYFVKPLDVQSLVDHLEQTLHPENQPPMRVMIVDDSVALSRYYATALQDTDMETAIVNDPTQLLNEISVFNPELILMDLYMPGWNGYEVTRMLRQQDMYDSLPIIFISSERDPRMQEKALECGADDFLTKPIDPLHLIAAVRHRTQRYRKLRRYMERDGLTGLLNHSKMKELLENELSRARRNSTALSCVMIDLDHFKTINDRFGHPTGDRVLKALARLFQQRLRRSDLIARYGGEEFMLILPETPAEKALPIVEELRQSFSSIEHAQPDGHFHVTFSAGIASFPGITDGALLSAAADQALYRAKKAGRNCVVVC